MNCSHEEIPLKHANLRQSCFWDSLEKFHTASHFVGSPSSASAAGKSFSLKLSKSLDKLGELIWIKIVLAFMFNILTQTGRTEHV